MGVRKSLKRAFFGGLNPKRLLGFDVLKSQGKTVGDIYKTVLKSDKAPEGEAPKAFDEYLKEYGITEEKLQKRMKNARLTVWFCLGLSLVTFGYLFYQFIYVSFLGGLLSLVLTILLWSTAFREHFNLFQMKQRRLGCTIKEWYNSLRKQK